VENNKPPTRYEIHAATPGWAFIFTQAANAVIKEMSPHDVHCDIDPQVAHVMGYYEGCAVLDEESALGLILEDLAIITSMLTKDGDSLFKSVRRGLSDAAGILGEWKSPDGGAGVEVTTHHINIDFVPSVLPIQIGYNEETGHVIMSLEHTPEEE
jgi:hypothetical protein